MKRCADKFGFGRLLTDLLYPRRCAICDEVLPMGEGLICRGHNSLPYVKPPYGIDAVTCVPLHRRKQRQRGYNQAAVLAKVVADELGLPFCEDMLVRRKYTTPQKKLDNLERANNIKTSMDIGRVYPEYRNILLVDDIYTTGVTIDVCAGLLKKAGARHVYYSSVCVGKGC